MPDPTTRYGWNQPNVGGDTGAWGGVLNTLHDSVDEQVYLGAIDLAGTNDPLVFAASEGATGWRTTPGGATEDASANSGNNPLIIPLRHLRVGQRITAFQSRGSVTGSRAATVSLGYMGTLGTHTEVSAGHSLPASEATTTTSGLTHDVQAGRAYYLKVTPSGGSTAGDITNILFGRLTVIAT